MISFTFRCYLCFQSTRRVRVGGDDKNGPKRRQMCRLGPRCVFFSFMSFLTQSALFRAFFCMKHPPPIQVPPPHPSLTRSASWRGVSSFSRSTTPNVAHVPSLARSVRWRSPFHLPPHAAMTKTGPNDGYLSFGP